jgi:hypothetical protein
VTARLAGFRLAAATDDPSRRDLAFAQASAEVRREYSDFLEYELSRTRAALDKTQVALERTTADFRKAWQALEARERYIDALPSVRAKKWVVGRLSKRES